MRNLALDAALSDRFTGEPATSAHVDEAFDLAAAELTAAFGFNPDTAEDIRAWLEPPEGGRSAQLLIRDREQGALMQWWGALQEPGGELWHTWIRTHPTVLDAVGDMLCRFGYTALLDWMRIETPPERSGSRVHSGIAKGDDAAGRRLRDAGFHYERTFWEMIGSVTDSPQPAREVAGLSTGVARDAATVHQILSDAFTGAWGYEATPFNDWLALEKAMPGYDPDLWVLAEMDGTAVAIMILSRRSAADRALYVQELATVAPYRRRGIAAAMLRHAFDVAAAEGYDDVLLHVDSSNEHDAPTVYRRAGFEVRCAFNAFARDLGTADGDRPS